MKTIQFNNVHKLNEKEYMTFLSGEDLLSSWVENNIEYIPEIQRGIVTTQNKSGENIEKPVFSYANVKKIKKHIEDNTFYVNQITLNILDETEIAYDDDNKVLSVEDGIIALLDGQHRIRALEEIQKQNEKDDDYFVNLKDLVFPVKITNYSKEKAQEQFYQFTLGSKISSSRIEFFNNKDYSNKITKELYNDSILKDKIETVKNNITKKEKDNIVSFATLKNAIETHFNTNSFVSDHEYENTSEFLKEFFEELFFLVPEFNDYEERMNLKAENNFKCENVTFYGYLAVAKYLETKENWKELLANINEINFDKTQEPWISSVIKPNQDRTTYSIVNNNQSRKDIANIMLKLFKEKISDYEQE